jgi:hypothetical protein
MGFRTYLIVGRTPRMCPFNLCASPFSSLQCQFEVFIIVHRFSSGFGKVAGTARPEFFAGRKYDFSM